MLFRVLLLRLGFRFLPALGLRIGSDLLVHRLLRLEVLLAAVPGLGGRSALGLRRLALDRPHLGTRRFGLRLRGVLVLFLLGVVLPLLLDLFGLGRRGSGEGRHRGRGVVGRGNRRDVEIGVRQIVLGLELGLGRAAALGPVALIAADLPVRARLEPERLLLLARLPLVLVLLVKTVLGQCAVPLLGPLVHLLRAYGTGLPLRLRVEVLLPGAVRGLLRVVLALALVGAGGVRLLGILLFPVTLLLALLLGLLGAIRLALRPLVGGLVDPQPVLALLLLFLLLLLRGLLPGLGALVLLLGAPGSLLLLSRRVRLRPAPVAAALLVPRLGVLLLLAGVLGLPVLRLLLALFLAFPLGALDAEQLEEVRLRLGHLGRLEVHRLGFGLLGEVQQPVVLAGEQPYFQPVQHRVLQPR